MIFSIFDVFLTFFKKTTKRNNNATKSNKEQQIRYKLKKQQKSTKTIIKLQIIPFFINIFSQYFFYFSNTLNILFFSQNVFILFFTQRCS